MMSEAREKSVNAGPESVVEALLSTLASEVETLTRLSQTFELQIEALRSREHDLLEQATLQANDEIANLARLRQTHERQMRLLSRTIGIDAEKATLEAMIERMEKSESSGGLAERLRASRASLRSRAGDAQNRCRELEEALQFAVQIGRELMQALQGLDMPPGSAVYTAQGSARQTTTPRPLLNQMG